MLSHHHLFQVTFLIIFIKIGTTPGYTQQIVDFEHFINSNDTFINNAEEAEGFYEDPLFLPNMYNPMWDAWTGWSISSARDTMQPGFINQYSAISGGGNNGSRAFAVGYSASGNHVKFTDPVKLEGLFVTNSTYVYYSMKDGDAFAKKFGGETGNDPDFLLLTIQKYLNGVLDDIKVEVYLADYRFDRPQDDYILKDWTHVDLSQLGTADSLLFVLSSSDNGPFGMNTPAYFCIDNVDFFPTTTSDDLSSKLKSLQIYPNPVHYILYVRWMKRTSGQASIFDIYGEQYGKWNLSPGLNSIPVSYLAKGSYFLKPISMDPSTPVKFIKY